MAITLGFFGNAIAYSGNNDEPTRRMIQRMDIFRSKNMVFTPYAKKRTWVDFMGVL